MTDHAAGGDAGRTVTCDRCKHTYVLNVDSGLIVGLGDQVATCRECGHSITRRPGRACWMDATGRESCPRGGTHEPVPDGPGAPVEVPGTNPQWRLL